MVRSIGVIGGGKDPMETAIGMKTPREAAAYLRAEEEQRLREIRSIVIVANDYHPVRIDDIVAGRPASLTGEPIAQGRRRQPPDAPGPAQPGPGPRCDEQRLASARIEKVQGIILMRKGENRCRPSTPSRNKVEELNKPRPAAARRRPSSPTTTATSWSTSPRTPSSTT